MRNEIPAAAPIRYAEILWLSVAMGVIVAGLHTGYLTARHEILGRFSQTTPDFVWIAPLTYAICFVAGAVPLLLLRWRSPARVKRATVLGYGSGLGVFALLLLVPRVHALAWLVVAIGVGVRVASLSPGRAARWARGLVRVAIGVGAISALVGVVRTIGPQWRERAAQNRPRVAAEDAPNVLLIIWDTVRAANISVYGYERSTTPFLDSLSREGVVFERAFSPAAWTLPSHASMMTGVWARQTGTSYLTPTNPEFPTLAERLSAAGYMTAGFMANAGWAGHESGVGKGFHRYETYPLAAAQLLSSSTLTTLGISWNIIGGLTTASPGRVVDAILHPDFEMGTPGRTRLRSGEEIADRFLEWREEIGDRHPYFAMLNMMEAHWPYASPEPYSSRFNGGAEMIDRYDGGIAYLDNVLGHIVNALARRGELDRTLVVVTSDHGEMFGEHGLSDHGNSVYLPVVTVPFVVRYPRRFPPGVRRPEVVSLRDLAATVLDAVGLGPSLPGRSLVDRPAEPFSILLHASAGVRQPENFRTAHGPVDGVLNRPWHLITNPDSTLELYDWLADPEESTNLVPGPVADSIIPGLRRTEATLLRTPPENQVSQLQH